MKSKYTLSTEKIKREKKYKKIFKIVLIIIVLLLLLSYFIIGIIYNKGNFSITLDKNLYFSRGLIVYDDPEYKVYRSELYAPVPNSFDNISYKWLPEDVDQHDGSHNGNNYLAYTFYVENIGESITEYWSEIIIDDVIKNVDDAVRVRVYRNDNYITYAKAAHDGNPEPETTTFESDKVIRTEQITNFKPGDINKYTIVIWVEGSDPECTDNILGGEFKVHMNFNSEHIEK